MEGYKMDDLENIEFEMPDVEILRMDNEDDPITASGDNVLPIY